MLEEPQRNKIPKEFQALPQLKSESKSHISSSVMISVWELAPELSFMSTETRPSSQVFIIVFCALSVTDVFNDHSFPQKQKRDFLVFNCCDFKWSFLSLRLTETFWYVLYILKSMSLYSEKAWKPPTASLFFYSGLMAAQITDHFSILRDGTAWH